MDMNQTKFIDLFMLKLCNLNGWKIVMQLNYIKCQFRQNIFLSVLNRKPHTEQFNTNLC